MIQWISNSHLKSIECSEEGQEIRWNLEDVVREGCNGIKQFEKYSFESLDKNMREKQRTGEKKTEENCGEGRQRGKGDEWWESSILNEEVKVYKRNFSQDPWKLRDWMGKRGKREVLWRKCRLQKKFSFRIQDTKVKKFANNKKIQKNPFVTFLPMLNRLI